MAQKMQAAGYEMTTWAGGTVYYAPAGMGASRAGAYAGTTPGVWLYPVPDVTGTAMVWANGAGQIVTKSFTGPYGEELGVFTEPGYSSIGFAGYVSGPYPDNVSYTPNRYLSNLTGRFMSVDPSGSINIHDPRTFNQYAYVAGNPLTFVDPAGLYVYVVTYAMDKETQWEFRSAAETFAHEIQSAEGYDSKADYVLFRELNTFADLEQTFSAARGLGTEYGKVAAWAHFSHGGPNSGPYFGKRGDLDANQVSMDRLSTIDFNFADTAIAAFYSCNSAKFAKEFASSFHVQSYGYEHGTNFSAGKDARVVQPRFWSPIAIPGSVYLLQSEGQSNGASFWKSLMINTGFVQPKAEPMLRYDVP
jgi:RHS repeat-associated protein